MGGVGYADYLAEGSWFSELVWSEIADELADRRPAKGRLLDIGCAGGFLVEAADRAGWEAEGIDVSDFAVRAGRDRGLKLQSTTLRDAGYAAETFDAITMFHTLEHLVEPREEMTEVRRITRSGGVLAVEVPNAGSLGFRARRGRWTQLKPPEHVCYYDRRALSALLTTTGWRVEKVITRQLAEFTAQAHTTRGSRAAEQARRLALVVARTGVVTAVERLGLGGNLRIIATAV